MSEVIYVSKVRIERFGGGHRRAHLPVGEAADFGVHDEIAEHYGMTPGHFEPHAATLPAEGRRGAGGREPMGAARRGGVRALSRFLAAARAMGAAVPLTGDILARWANHTVVSPNARRA